MIDILHTNFKLTSYERSRICSQMTLVSMIYNETVFKDQYVELTFSLFLRVNSCRKLLTIVLELSYTLVVLPLREFSELLICQCQHKRKPRADRSLSFFLTTFHHKRHLLEHSGVTTVQGGRLRKPSQASWPSYPRYPRFNRPAKKPRPSGVPRDHI